MPQRFHGRVFALNTLVAWSTLPIGFGLVAPYGSALFEPLLAPDGPLAGTVGAVIGTGAGRGHRLHVRPASGSPSRSSALVALRTRTLRGSTRTCPTRCPTTWSASRPSRSASDRSPANRSPRRPPSGADLTAAAPGEDLGGAAGRGFSAGQQPPQELLQRCHVPVGAAPLGEQVLQQMQLLDELAASEDADHRVDEGALGRAPSAPGAVRWRRRRVLSPQRRPHSDHVVRSARPRSPRAGPRSGGPRLRRSTTSASHQVLELGPQRRAPVDPVEDQPGQLVGVGRWLVREPRCRRSARRAGGPSSAGCSGSRR